MIETKVGDKTICRELTVFVVDKEAKRIVIQYDEWEKNEETPAKQVKRVVIENKPEIKVDGEVTQAASTDYDDQYGTIGFGGLDEKINSYLASIK